LGRFDVHGGVSGSVSFDDYVDVTTNGTVLSDVYWTLSPTVSVKTEGPNGRMVSLTYTPSFIFFTDNPDLNSINHSGSFQLTWPMNRLTLNLSELVAIETGIVRDIADRATLITYSTTASADYVLSDKTSLSLSMTYLPLDYGGTSYGGIAYGGPGTSGIGLTPGSTINGVPVGVYSGSSFISSQYFTEQLSLNYRFSDRITGSLGIACSQVDVENAPLQTGYGPNLTVTYAPDERTSLSAGAGFQYQQFDSGTPAIIAPTFNLTGSFKPRPELTLTLNGTRSDYPSAVSAGENYSNTAFSFSVSQGFLANYTASATLSYVLADYYATQPGVQTHRTDSYYLFTAALNRRFGTHWSVGLLYERISNNSTTTFSYDQNIVSLTGGWTF
jgi:hypothetical protein